MRHSGLLWATLVSITSCLLSGELTAQQPLQSAQISRGQSSSNVNAQQARQPAAQSARTAVTRHDRPAGEPSYIAVIGAVKIPSVFETNEPAELLKTLIERAGGQTSESIGTVRIMEHTQTRFMTTLRDHLDLAVTHGQVVFVVPRGGRPARVTEPGKAVPDRFVLISGLARGPLLFNIGNQSRTLGDLLLLLGQSPELLAQQKVKATQPQGQWMELDSLLVHNTVIDFDPESVNTDGVRSAVDKGFRYELPVKLVATPAVAPAANGPVELAPAESVVAPQSPLVQPPPIRARVAPPVTSDLNSVQSPSGVERAGSTITFDEPLPLPARFKDEADENAGATVPSQTRQPQGRTPLMLPKTWQQPQADDAESEDVEVDPARMIERTSAGLSSGGGDIVTVSAEVEVASPRQTTLAKTTPPSETNSGRPAPQIEQTASSFPGPQSWLALLASVGVAVTSVVVSRIVSREDSSDHNRTETASDTEAIAPSANTEEQRFLQRLIMNKIPLIEEEAVLPPVDRLHGMSIGGRRLIVHEAHAGVAGPHFQVRDRKSTQAIELRLKRLMRSDRAPTTQPSMLVTTSQGSGVRSSRVSPLERALRNVEQGDT